MVAAWTLAGGRDGGVFMDGLSFVVLAFNRYLARSVKTHSPPQADKGAMSPTYKAVITPPYKAVTSPTYKPSTSPTYKPSTSPTYKFSGSPSHSPISYVLGNPVVVVMVCRSARCPPCGLAQSFWHANNDNQIELITTFPPQYLSPKTRIMIVA